jgi:hypothetical protein
MFMTTRSRLHAAVRIPVILSFLLTLVACTQPDQGPPANNGKPGSANVNQAVQRVDGHADKTVDLSYPHTFQRLAIIAHCSASNAGKYTLTVTTDTGANVWGPVTLTEPETRSVRKGWGDIKEIRSLVVKLEWEDAPEDLTARLTDSNENVAKTVLLSTVAFQGAESRGMFTTPIGVTIVAVN